ncbi:MAG: hypothetical protein FJ388_23290, partial [Verrucomicrobia bacterium]|nr:hypothetical protein [Verrucomicrobiota bacterium]
MKTKIFLVLAAVMGGAGLAAIGTAMLVQAFRTPATTPVAPAASLQTSAAQASAPQTPAASAAVPASETALPVAVPNYLQPQSAASPMLQPVIKTEAPASQPVGA